VLPVHGHGDTVSRPSFLMEADRYASDDQADIAGASFEQTSTTRRCNDMSPVRRIQQLCACYLRPSPMMGRTTCLDCLSHRLFSATRTQKGTEKMV